MRDSLGWDALGSGTVLTAAAAVSFAASAERLRDCILAKAQAQALLR